MDYSVVEAFRDAVRNEDADTCNLLISKCNDRDTLVAFKDIIESQGTPVLVKKLRF